MDKPKKMSQKEAGRLGGLATVDKYGEDWMGLIGQAGGGSLLRKRGSEYFREIGRKGGFAKAARSKERE